jgi:hypothetical protein
MSDIAYVIVVALAAWLGYEWRGLVIKINELEQEMQNDAEPDPRTGPTLGSYHHIDEINPHVDDNPKKPKARVVVPKTPQKVDWDATQELNEQNKKFKVGPNK